MPLKFKYESKEEVPTESLPLYVERDGGFVLDVEGAVEKSKLDEFRSNNIALSNQLAETKRRFEGIESEQVRAVAAERDALNARLTAIQVDQGVVACATRKGLRPSAIPDITARARSVFKLVEGEVEGGGVAENHNESPHVVSYWEIEDPPTLGSYGAASEDEDEALMSAQISIRFARKLAWKTSAGLLSSP